MATNNTVNLKSSGIVSYDAAGAFTALANPLTVSNGGQGGSSFTTYTPLCGGTTSTNPVQSVASLGSSGQVLLSNGAGALPTFQTLTGGFTTLPVWQTLATSFVSTTDYFARMLGVWSTTGDDARTRFYIPRTGTITAVYVYMAIGGPGSGESATLKIRINNTTDNTISSSIITSSSPQTYNLTGLSIAVTAGDYMEYKLTTPSYSSAPTAISSRLQVLIQ